MITNQLACFMFIDCKFVTELNQHYLLPMGEIFQVRFHIFYSKILSAVHSEGPTPLTVSYDFIEDHTSPATEKHC